MLMFINFSEWMEQFILIIRGIWPELYEVDVEIAVLLAVINTSVPLLYIVVQTPNWSCRKSSLQIMLGKSMPWFCHGPALDLLCDLPGLGLPHDMLSIARGQSQ
ncbi:unnamed protein product [Durusdinium trenchii]|uniref:Uncharacterized protein n=2 Tax=Durusdinium trenchii TaxID=1381693 RepID=A0ABP0KYP5_9DINO